MIDFSLLMIYMSRNPIAVGLLIRDLMESINSLIKFVKFTERLKREIEMDVPSFP